MEKHEHRLGVSEINLVERHLKLIPQDKSKISFLLKELDELYGMDEVSLDANQWVIRLAYDATRINLEEVETLLTQHGVQVSDDWWTHVKEGYYKFVDRNVQENAAHEPWSCHTDPQHSPRKKPRSR